MSYHVRSTSLAGPAQFGTPVTATTLYTVPSGVRVLVKYIPLLLVAGAATLQVFRLHNDIALSGAQLTALDDGNNPYLGWVADEGDTIGLYNNGVGTVNWSINGVVFLLP